MSDSNQSQKLIRLKVTGSPHLHSNNTTFHVMREVVLALMPALVMSVLLYGSKAAGVVFMAVFGAVIAEYICQKVLMKKQSTICDLSAVVTGILLAFCLPAATPFWMAFIGGVIAITIVKQAYGGLGQNIFNPALAARAFLLASWPVSMNTWMSPKSGLGLFEPVTDAVTSATPLAVLKDAMQAQSAFSEVIDTGMSVVESVMVTLNISWQNLLTGSQIAGSLGESSRLMLLIGGVYLFYKGHISWHIPVTMTGTVFFGALIYSGGAIDYAIFHVLSGGLILGALFMATDMVTSPITTKGQLIFGLGCGILTLLIRIKGGFPEGVCYAILIMNAAVPIIDSMTAPVKFGQTQEAKT